MQGSAASPTEEHAALRWGWLLLCVGALGGVVLESLHAFKSAVYLDDSLTRLLLTLAHAHAVGLALVVLAYAVAGAPWVASLRWPGRAIRFASASIPLGFALGAVGHPEGDPSWPIVLVPIGALALVAGLVRVTLVVWRRS